VRKHYRRSLYRDRLNCIQKINITKLFRVLEGGQAPPPLQWSTHYGINPVCCELWWAAFVRRLAVRIEMSLGISLRVASVVGYTLICGLTVLHSLVTWWLKWSGVIMIRLLLYCIYQEMSNHPQKLFDTPKPCPHGTGGVKSCTYNDMSMLFSARRLQQQAKLLYNWIHKLAMVST